MINFWKRPTNDINMSHFPKLSSILKINSHTPYYLVNKAIIESNQRFIKQQLTKLWGENFSLAYSFKTNYSIAKEHSFDMAEVVSLHEYSLAKRYGYHDQKIIVNGPYKQKLKSLLSKPLTINLDNFSEVNALISTNKISASIGLRVNTSAHKSRFGFNLEDGSATKAISLILPKIKNIGIHFHAGSDIQDPQIYQVVSQKISEFIKTHDLANNINYIDFGGGFPSHGIIPGTHIQSQPNYHQYLSNICQPLRSCFSSLPLPKLFFEFGRYLVDDATVFITTIIDHRRSNGRQHIIVDSTINMLPSTWYRQNLVRPLTKKSKSQRHLPTTIFGSSCQEIDTLYTGDLPLLNIGDKVVFYCVGAYNQSQSTDFIFSRPKTYVIKTR